MTLIREMKEVARGAGGSFGTIKARTQIASQLAKHLKEQNIQIRSLGHLKAAHVENWLAKGKAEGLSSRTLQNRLTAVRSILRASGHENTLKRLEQSGKTVGIAGAPRTGVRSAMPTSTYQEKINQVHDEGVKAALELMRTLGLRQKEALMSVQSLETWHRQMQSDRHGRILLVAGSKGGRPREIWPVDIPAALRAIDAALGVAVRRDGKLVEGDLKGALSRFNREAAGAGFKGIHSPHSLRYGFAQAWIEKRLAEGHSKRDALAFTSQVLGHGDGRGRWIAAVYGKNSTSSC